MSVQLINLVILVAIINGVYSDIECQNSTLPTLPKKEFRIALVKNVGSVRNGLNKFFKGSLIYESSSQKVEVKLDSEEEGKKPPNTTDDIILLSGQELTYFKGKLYAANVSRRIHVYQEGRFKWRRTIPIMPDIGNQKMPISWATAQGDVLYVGPNGIDGFNYMTDVREDTDENFTDFTPQFNSLKKKAGMENGYMIHESCVYSEIHNEFYFLPKKASPTVYNQEADLTNAANILLSMGKDMDSFNKVAEIKHSPEHKDRGYSSFAFVPNTGDEVIVALQTSDVTNCTYITAFTREGTVVLQSMQIFEGQLKGLAFLLTSKTDG